jgi:hypothetical protein
MLTEIGLPRVSPFSSLNLSEDTSQLNEQKDNNTVTKVDYEGGVPVLRRLSEMERKQTESDRREQEQIRLNRGLVIATVALVVCTVALGGVQACYMHRQWKLNSDGLSKMGDQIWAAKDAAFAARQVADTAVNESGENKRQFDKTLKQMQGQTSAQMIAAQASQRAADISRQSLFVSQRPYLTLTTVVSQPLTQASPPTVTLTFRNSGQTPAMDVHPGEWDAFVDSKKINYKIPAAKEGGNIDIAKDDAKDMDLQFMPEMADMVDFFLTNYNQGTKAISVKGNVLYTDIFNESCSLSFCAIRKPKSRSVWNACGTPILRCETPKGAQ